MWSIYTMEYYAAIKRNEALTLATAWTNLDYVMRRKRSQTHKAAVCDSIHVKCPAQAHPQGQKVGEWVSGAEGGGLRECSMSTGEWDFLLG